MKKFLCVCLLLACSFNLMAQKRNHELALDMAPLFRKDNSFGFLYRSHKQQQAFRLMLNAQLDIGQTEDNLTINTQGTSTQHIFTETDFYSVDTRVGWQRSVADIRQWNMYSGVDLVFGYDYTGTNQTTRSPGGFGDMRVEATNSISEMRYGLAPFIGFAFQLNEKITFSTETAILFQGYSVNSKKEEYVYFTDNKGVESLNATEVKKSTSDGVRMSISPAEQFRLYVSIHF